MMAQAVKTVPVLDDRGRYRRGLVPLYPETGAAGEAAAKSWSPGHRPRGKKYGVDRFYDWFFAGGARKFGSGLWRFGGRHRDRRSDGERLGEAHRVVAGVVRLVQSGFIYHYAFFMIIAFPCCSRTSSFSEGRSSAKKRCLLTGSALHMGPDRRGPHRPCCRRQEYSRSAVDLASRRDRRLSRDDSARHGFQTGTSAMQFVELNPWIPRFNVNYHLGVDGISVLFILLNSFITVLVVIAGWR